MLRAWGAARGLGAARSISTAPWAPSAARGLDAAASKLQAARRERLVRGEQPAPPPKPALTPPPRPRAAESAVPSARRARGVEHGPAKPPRLEAQVLSLRATLEAARERVASLEAKAQRRAELARDARAQAAAQAENLQSFQMPRPTPEKLPAWAKLPGKAAQAARQVTEWVDQLAPDPPPEPSRFDFEVFRKAAARELDLQRKALVI